MNEIKNSNFVMSTGYKNFSLVYWFKGSSVWHLGTSVIYKPKPKRYWWKYYKNRDVV